MPTTIAAQILIDRIKARMQTILVANGYYTNAGQHVTVWKPNPFDKSEMDAIDVRDVTESSDVTVTETEDEVERHTADYELRLITGTSPQDQTARQMVADVRKAIKQDPLWKSGASVALAEKTLPNGQENYVDQDRDRVAGVIMRIRVQYLTDAFAEA